MVKSGLDEELISKTEIPRVSPYRLAAHLSLAFILYAGLIWCGLSQFIPRARVSYVTVTLCLVLQLIATSGNIWCTKIMFSLV